MEKPKEAIDIWWESQKDNYPSKKYLRTLSHKTLLEYWFNCWKLKDPQDYQDMEWDWDSELQKFIDDPIEQTQLAIKINPEICACCGDVKDDYLKALHDDGEKQEVKH